jgi:hypothetical protein
MTELREADLAWELVETFRGCLAPPQLTAVFVGLGVGDYTPVINTVLRAAARAGKPLSLELAAMVRAWRDCYEPHAMAANTAPLWGRASGDI